jgi:cytochrome c biogenesis protein CcmG/thiol:disulfide interchange protein DsbE
MSRQDSTPSSDLRRQRRNPIVIVLGFLLLGAAVGLLLFGSRLFERSDGDAAEAPVLDQVTAFATTAPSVAQIPSIGNGDSELQVGDEAHDFTLEDFDGRSVSLSDFRGRPVIINLWATWCPPCRIEMPELQAAYDKYQEQGLVILALDNDEPVEVGRAFFYDEMGLTFTPLVDTHASVAMTYSGLGVLPTSYFVDPQGIVTAIHRGPMTLEQIGGYLDEMLASAG